MIKTIRLRVTHPTLPPGPIEGFLFLWAFYVRGFDPVEHCQPCLLGKLAPNFHTGNVHTDIDILLDRMDEFEYVYICGVGAGKVTDRWKTNFHLPLRYVEDAGAIVGPKITYNDYQFVADHAVEMAIKPLPDDWHDLTREHARCKNFQFGVTYFGADGKGTPDSDKP